MSRYTDETYVWVASFDRRPEGDSVTIGDQRRGVFLSLPAEALVVLDCLSDGKTVGEARDRYESRYGETPDVDDLLNALEPLGFVAPRSNGTDRRTETKRLERPEADVPATLGSVAWLSQNRARWLCQRFAAPCSLLISGALVLIAIHPAVIPGPSVLVFRKDLAALGLGLFAFGLAGVAVHELAHLVVARAAGVPARIGVSHRLWFVVAETDMTGIWLAPRAARYRAFLAGPAVDGASASLLVVLLYGRAEGWIGLTPLEAQIVGACLMTYLLRLLWQCYLFVRTDFYYVLATAFSCKNLLGDTENFLHNRMATIFSSWRTVDQSSIPASEMRVIRWYSLLWLVGRAAAFLSLIFVTLPVIWRYGKAMAPIVVGGHSRYGLADAVFFAVVTVGVTGSGLFVYARSLLGEGSAMHFGGVHTKNVTPFAGDRPILAEFDSGDHGAQRAEMRRLAHRAECDECRPDGTIDVARRARRSFPERPGADRHPPG